MKKARLLRRIRFWPPYLGSGIRVTHVSDDLREVVVEMPLRRWNRNYVGTHFGGSLYSMTDPFYMLMLLHNLGRGYIVWDKAATIRFRKPGRGTVHARFMLTETILENIRAQADAGSKVEPEFKVQVTDSSGEIVAEVDKLLYVRRKN